MEWTPQQKSAIEAPTANLLVSAAAGSGKTQVLTHRILHKIMHEGGSIDRFLIVTFTRAAASEMRDRIIAALSRAAEESGDSALLQQASMASAASIDTIDAFCIGVLRQNFFAVDLPPDFSVCDRAEGDMLRAEALDEVLEELYEEASDAFLALAQSYGSAKNDSALCEMILKLHDFVRTFPDPDAQLARFAAAYHEDVPLSESVVGQFLTAQWRDSMDAARAALEEARAIAASSGLTAYCDCFTADLRLLEEEDPRADFARLPTVRSKAEEKELCKSLRERAKAEFSRAREAQAACNEDCRAEMAPLVDALTDAVRRLDAAFRARKLQKKLIDFGDCEHLALRVLRDSEGAPTAAALELAARYDELYIDEYQDSNALQDALFAAISRGESNLFMVGDVKQSIYRFRRADPTLFLQKADAYSDAADAPRRKIFLSHNFRSRREVVDAVNTVFTPLMTRDAAEIDYADGHALTFGATFLPESEGDYRAEFLELENAEDSEESLSALEAEAAVIADRICAMIAAPFLVADGGAMRPIQYRDIAVLSRTISSRAPVIEAVFTARGIPVFSDVGGGYFATSEVRTVMALLQTLDNPLQDIPLIAVLRSPIFHFDENELCRIRLTARGTLYATALAAAAEAETPLGQKCRDCLAKLDAWRRLSHLMPMEAFVTRLLQESGYFAFVGALSAGAQRQANLNFLIDCARAYERTGFCGLFRLIAYLERMHTASGDFGAAKELSPEMNVVRLMSVHKSKGLEFPVVFLCGAGSHFNSKDTSADLLLHPTLGLGLNCVDRERRIRYNTPMRRAIALQMRRETLAEELRILYVALTRAKEKLIVISSAKPPKRQLALEALLASNPKLFSKQDIWAATSVAQWLRLALIVQGGAHWSWRTVPAPSVLLSEEASPPPQGALPSREIAQRLDFVYPYHALASIASKVSVSELKHRQDDDAKALFDVEEPLAAPDFLNVGSRRLSGAERGTAYHTVMLHLDVHQADAAAQIAAMAQKGFLTADEAACIDPKAIARFLASPLGDAMRRARRVVREAAFAVSLPAREVDPASPADAEVCLQGVIDCYFEDENGDLVLLDYKTDHYTDPEELRKKYEKQLSYYEFALFQKYFRKSNKKYLYLFEKNDIIEVS